MNKLSEDLLNPFLPITTGSLSYLSEVIKIWMLEYPVQAISDPH